MLRSALRPVRRAFRDLGVAWQTATMAPAPRSRGVVRVWYGHARIPLPSARAHGGAVKLQSLARAFPNTPRRFTVLYLVSSSLPHGALRLAEAAIGCGAKLVVNQNGVGYPGWNREGWRQFNARRAALLAHADFAFYQSEFCRISADTFLGPRNGPSDILYNAVDTRLFHPVAQRPATRPPTLLMGGSHEQRYRIEAALQTVARLPNVRLIIAGRLAWTRPQRAFADTRARIEALGVGNRVQLLPAYAQEEAPDVFRLADVLLHTQYNDACPTVVLEAMACGLPVVYSASGGVPELVGADAGVAVVAERRWDAPVVPDPAQLADAVVEALDRRAQLSQAARQRVIERFDLLPWLRRHQQVFEQLVS